ncbi:MAG TPA: uracil-DNA glycosylase [Candidatus Thermoplasmatota archaeon]|nr:uracil-DNA glycosylase [Candidatus Thermoplasmatota archaeon]
MGIERGTAYVPVDCRRCGLCEGRTQVVPAEGGRRPLAFFVGEAPGPEEDAQGRPFVGRAGKILRATLREAGWSDDDVWITNVVKCFPYEWIDGKKKIRAPTVAEAASCREHLRLEVAALKPPLIVALGRTAATALIDDGGANLAGLRGSASPARGDLGGDVFVTYHPSGLHYERGRKEAFESDLRAALRLAKERRGA